MAKAKEIGGLDCGAEAGAGVMLVLATRLEEMFGFRASALDFGSPDGVHDMRVASRRLRSALRAFGPHMRGGKRVEAARDELKRMADALGAVRDEDVAIRALERLEQEAPPEARAGLASLADARRARREVARAELVLALEEERFEDARRRILDAFRRATAPRKGKGGDDPAVARSFRDVGRRIIACSREELRERAHDLYRPLASKRLHRLRITAKRLRYALELFDPCFGGGLRDVARHLADLQTALGDLHDCDEWAEEAGRKLSARESEPENRTSGVGGDAAARREAAHWLLEHFALKRARHYGEALALWRTWEREDLDGRVAECTGGGGV